MIYGCLLRTACFIAGTLCIVNFRELCLKTAWRLPANCLQIDCQLPAIWLKMPYCNFNGQYDLWLAFTHSMFYCRNTVHRQLLGALPEDCQLPKDWLPTACQLTKDWLPIWFMAGFYAQHVLLQEHCPSSTSETCDRGLPDDCWPTACKLPANCLPAD